VPVPGTLRRSTLQESIVRQDDGLLRTFPPLSNTNEITLNRTKTGTQHGRAWVEKPTMMMLQANWGLTSFRLPKCQASPTPTPRPRDEEGLPIGMTALTEIQRYCLSDLVLREVEPYGTSMKLLDSLPYLSRSTRRPLACRALSIRVWELFMDRSSDELVRPIMQSTEDLFLATELIGSQPSRRIVEPPSSEKPAYISSANRRSRRS